MNKTIEKMVKDKMKELLPLCTESQQQMFKRMYIPKKLDSSIDDAVDNLRYDQLDNAMNQIEKTIDGNQYRLSK